MASYENFFSESTSSLDPNYGNFVGYRLPTSQLSLPTDPRTANQVKSASERINTGMKHVELGALSPEIFESIPEQHLKELNRMTKLTGVKASIHAPLVDPAGYTGKGGWDEQQRIAAERQIKSAVMRSHEIDPDGNIVVNFHSTSSEMPGTEFKVEEVDGKKKISKFQIMAINQETGQSVPIRTEERFYPEEVGEKILKGQKVIGEVHDVTKELDIANRSEWHQNLSQVLFYKNRGDELMQNNYDLVKPLLPELAKAKTEDEAKKFMDLLKPDERTAYNQTKTAEEFYEHSGLVLRNLFSKAYKYGTEEERKRLNEIAIDFNNKVGKGVKNLQDYGNALQEMTIELQHVKPKLYIPLEEFRIQKASDTFSNVALDSYKKFGSSSPVIAIENPPAGSGLSTGEDLKKLAEETRKKFVEKAVKSGVGRSEAEDAAKKFIGVTWDVGHINMLRRYGYEKDELMEETKKVAPFVKHVHLSDNFGFEHTELPMGMGNVPIKDILERLGKEGFKGDKVIEAGNWWQHFSEQGKVTPLNASLEAFGSPLYSQVMAPYWNQALGGVGGYFAGYGTMLPDQHFSMYGAGFEQLPVELGGQVQGKRDRFGGAPMD